MPQTKSYYILSLLMLIILSHSCVQKKGNPLESAFSSLKGPYLGQNTPGKTPEIFAPGIVSTMLHEHSIPSFSPDGNQVLWNSNFVRNGRFPRRVIISNNKNGNWSEPDFFDPITLYESQEAFFSPDGKRVYFSSRSVENSKEETLGNWNIWYIEKSENDWTPPEKLELPISGLNKDAGSPTLTREGTLYFNGYYEHGLYNHGIYRSELVDRSYQTPELLPENINRREYVDWTPFIAPDESYLLFASNRPEGYGSDDLFISFRNVDNTWTDPINLGPNINTRFQDRYPYISPDGKYLFFISNKHDPELQKTPTHNLKYYKEKMTQTGNSWNDMYWVDASFIEDLRPKN